MPADGKIGKREVRNMLMNRLNQVLNETDLTDSGHAIARSLKHAMKYRQNINISSIAESAGVSKAMVTKFSRTLGYDGFSELKRAYAAYLEHAGEKEDPFSASQFMTAFRRMAQEFDEKDFEERCHELCADLCRCRCLYLYGTGENRNFCLMLQDRLFQAGIPAVVLDDQLQKNYAVKDHSVLLVIGAPVRKLLRFGQQCEKRYILDSQISLPGYHTVYVPDCSEEMKDCVLFLSIRLLSAFVLSCGR